MSSVKDLFELLLSKDLTIGSIESMTGGAFSSFITKEPGASKIYKGSIISYSKLIKCNIVNVKKSTIDTFGVVSYEVASEMAINGRELLDVDYCISVTGNAGPTYEDKSDENSSIFIAIASKDNIWGIPVKFNGTRDENILNTVDTMVNFLVTILKDN